MIKRGITELKKNLSKVLNGSDIIHITRYGKVIAVLIPKANKMFGEVKI